MKNMNEMTRKEFEALPVREWDEDVGEFDTLVILPSRKRHESGYRYMDFVAVTKDKMIRLSGCSDVLHIDGIGGYGKNWFDRFGAVPNSIEPKGWSIDCLPKSGLLQIFCYDKITADHALSSFSIYSERKKT